MRLVDAEAAVKAIDDALRRVFKEQVGEEIISRVPTVDAVPVVRCKDCRYYERNNHKCEVFRAIVCDNFYCKDGEKKDGDEHE